MQKRKLFLIPVGLAAENSGDWVGAHLRNAVLPLRRFVVEHPKSARQFLKTLGLPLHELEFEVLDEHSKPEDLDRLAHWLESSGDIGLLSEAGCPAIADPGAALVGRAHRLGMRVVPLVGPSSIVLALMASGLNGQRFAFNGYLPQSPSERDARIRELEALCTDVLVAGVDMGLPQHLLNQLWGAVGNGELPHAFRERQISRVRDVGDGFEKRFAFGELIGLEQFGPGAHGRVEKELPVILGIRAAPGKRHGHAFVGVRLRHVGGRLVLVREIQRRGVCQSLRAVRQEREQAVLLR